MAFESDSPLDSLWKEYGRAFQDWDDLTLGAGWRKRSASSKAGRGGFRTRSSARTGSRRNSRTTGRSGSSGWPRRRRLMRNRRAAARPFLPLLTRDVRESGLICQHCNETLVPFDEISADFAPNSIPGRNN